MSDLFKRCPTCTGQCIVENDDPNGDIFIDCPECKTVGVVPIGSDHRIVAVADLADLVDWIDEAEDTYATKKYLELDRIRALIGGE